MAMATLPKWPESKVVNSIKQVNAAKLFRQVGPGENTCSIGHVVLSHLRETPDQRSARCVANLTPIKLNV
jgi:hypothetical protein